MAYIMMVRDGHFAELVSQQQECERENYSISPKSVTRARRKILLVSLRQNDNNNINITNNLSLTVVQQRWH